VARHDVRSSRGPLALQETWIESRVLFARHLHEGIRRGRITCSVRIWVRPHVNVGGRYRMEEGQIEVESIEPIELGDVTPALARESGFNDVQHLLSIARHGAGKNVYLIRFQYIRPGGWRRVDRVT
jgi:hypothetical protein